jgi:hypothetical protein
MEKDLLNIYIKIAKVKKAHIWVRTKIVVPGTDKLPQSPRDRILWILACKGSHRDEICTSKYRSQ